MICPNCGRELKESFKFCTGCGARLDELIVQAEDEITERSAPVQNFLDSFDYENEETVILDYIDESEDTLTGDYSEEDSYISEKDVYDSFENEETVIIQDYEDNIEEAAPDYEFKEKVPVYKAPPSQYEQDTAYIDHLRALKQLMDDGIITEDEFVRKKQQILGI